MKAWLGLLLLLVPGTGAVGEPCAYSSLKSGASVWSAPKSPGEWDVRFGTAVEPAYIAPKEKSAMHKAWGTRYRAAGSLKLDSLDPAKSYLWIIAEDGALVVGEVVRVPFQTSKGEVIDAPHRTSGDARPRGEGAHRWRPELGSGGQGLGVQR